MGASHFAIALAIVLRAMSVPAHAIAMKPLGDAFIRLITMIITLMIFCTVVTGIAGMQDMKKVGRVGGKALLYFEIVSTFASGRRPGGRECGAAGKRLQCQPGHARRQSRGRLCRAGQSAERHRLSDAHHSDDGHGRLRQGRHPASRSCGSILFGFALSVAGPRAKILVDLLGALTKVVFRMVNIVMRLAPIGAFGAMAFTIGKYRHRRRSGLWSS